MIDPIVLPPCLVSLILSLPQRVQGKRTDDLVVGPQFEFGWKKLGVFSFDSFDRRHTGRVTEDDYAVIAKYYGFPVLSMRDAFWMLAAQKVR